ncbi:MAG: hypothetical protein K1X57_10840 [Gemmataceae bacterium]|nr:hypothetical protein [Gemmataceae bacterium]
MAAHWCHGRPAPSISKKSVVQTMELLEAIGEVITALSLSNKRSPWRRVLTAILTILFVMVAVYLIAYWPGTA